MHLKDQTLQHHSDWIVTLLAECASFSLPAGKELEVGGAGALQIKKCYISSPFTLKASHFHMIESV
jgi:hypothetical protein